jgi:hypothetical protein
MVVGLDYDNFVTARFTCVAGDCFAPSPECVRSRCSAENQPCGPINSGTQTFCDATTSFCAFGTIVDYFKGRPSCYPLVADGKSTNVMGLPMANELLMYVLDPRDACLDREYDSKTGTCKRRATADQSACTGDDDCDPLALVCFRGKCVSRQYVNKGGDCSRDNGSCLPGLVCVNSTCVPIHLPDSTCDSWQECLFQRCTGGVCKEHANSSIGERCTDQGECSAICSV